MTPSAALRVSLLQSSASIPLRKTPPLGARGLAAACPAGGWSSGLETAAVSLKTARLLRSAVTRPPPQPRRTRRPLPPGWSGGAGPVGSAACHPCRGRCCTCRRPAAVARAGPSRACAVRAAAGAGDAAPRAAAARSGAPAASRSGVTPLSPGRSLYTTPPTVASQAAAHLPEPAAPAPAPARLDSAGSAAHPAGRAGRHAPPPPCRRRNRR